MPELTVNAGKRADIPGRFHAPNPFPIPRSITYPARPPAARRTRAKSFCPGCMSTNGVISPSVILSEAKDPRRRRHQQHRSKLSSHESIFPTSAPDVSLPLANLLRERKIS